MPIIIHCVQSEQVWWMMIFDWYRDGFFKGWCGCHLFSDFEEGDDKFHFTDWEKK